MARPPRQAEIPGTERPRIKEVDDAAEAYVVQRDKRMKLSKKEKEAKTALISVMEKHKIEVYRDTEADLLVTVSEVTNVKVEKLKAEETADETEAEEETEH